MNREDEIRYIKENVSIQSIMNMAGIKYKKSGKYLRAYSLLVEEKHPDLIVDIKKNYFWDNSAGIHGSVIDFYIYVYGIDYITAIKNLRSIAGLEKKEINRKIKLKPKYNDYNKAKEEFEILMGSIMQIRNKTKYLKKIRNFILEIQNKINKEIINEISEEDERVPLLESELKT